MFKKIKEKAKNLNIKQNKDGNADSAESKQPQYRARKLRKLTLKEKLILLVPAIAAVIAAVAISILLENQGVFTINEPGYQYYAGGTFPIAAGTKMQADSSGNAMIKTKPGSRPLNGFPIYCAERDAIILTEPAIYYGPRNDEFGALPEFTELSVDSYSTIELKGHRESAVKLEGFVYNGKDFYIFLEPMKVSFNGYMLTLPALSYIEAIYSGEVMVFNYETREFVIERGKGEVKASAISGDYTVYLMNDSYEMFDGRKALLFTRPDLLDNIVE